MLPEFKIYQPIQFGIFLTFATLKIAGKTKQQILISARIESLEPLYLHSHPALDETSKTATLQNLAKKDAVAVKVVVARLTCLPKIYIGGPEIN